MKAIGTTLVFASAVAALRLEARVGQSTAVCMQQFSWMASQNGHGVSPCQAVADLDAQCNNGNWVIDALNSTVHYPNPAGPKATFCTCSWASYNLISACTVCQGFPEQVPSWGSYSVGCAGLLTTNSFFPSNLTLPATIRVPFWAQKNPTEWTGQTFNSNEAQAIAGQGNPDFVGGTATPTVGQSTKKKSNTGAIAGGVIGGLVVIGAAVAIALWMIRRSRKSARGAQQLHTGSDMKGATHMRSMSDISSFRAPEVVMGYTNLSGGPMNGGSSGLIPPTSPVQTHFTGSARSVPYMSTVVGSTVPYGTTVPSPPPVPRLPTPVAGGSTRVEDIVVPFTSPPTLDANMDRKNPNGAFPVYSDPNAPHPNTSTMRMEIVRPRTPVARGQRFNPPSYEASESPDGASTSGRPGLTHQRSKQGSTDTTHSMTSSAMPQSSPSHSPNTSISMPGISEQMSTYPGPPTTSAQPQHGRKVSASTRDVKTRPGDDAFSARDIA